MHVKTEMRAGWALHHPHQAYVHCSIERGIRQCACVTRRWSVRARPGLSHIRGGALYNAWLRQTLYARVSVKLRVYSRKLRLYKRYGRLAAAATQQPVPLFHYPLSGLWKVSACTRPAGQYHPAHAPHEKTHRALARENRKNPGAFFYARVVRAAFLCSRYAVFCASRARSLYDSV